MFIFKLHVHIFDNKMGCGAQELSASTSYLCFLAWAASSVILLERALTSAILYINRLLSWSVDFQSPLQVLSWTCWCSCNPHILPQVFGYVAFVHLHKLQRILMLSSSNEKVVCHYECWISWERLLTFVYIPVISRFLP